jgi:hypothetical protein
VELKPEFGFFSRELNQNRTQGSFFLVEPENKKSFQIFLKNWNRRFLIKGKNRPTLVKANYGRMKRCGLKWIVQKFRKRLTLYFWCMRRDRIGETFPTMDGWKEVDWNGSSKRTKAANTYGVCAETESVKLFQLWMDAENLDWNRSSKSTKAANTATVCAQTKNR